jgi:hypothetical protein
MIFGKRQISCDACCFGWAEIKTGNMSYCFTGKMVKHLTLCWVTILLV